MKIVLDTNIYIAGFATKGLCSSLVEICLNDHTVYISDYILNEIKCVLHKKLKLPDNVILDINKFILKNTELIKPVYREISICRDKDDVAIINLAEGVRADYLITGDDDLLSIQNKLSISVVSPREFWSILSIKKR